MAFLLFGWLRLAFGAATKNRRIAELNGYAETYGRLLTEHHGSKVSCDEATGPLKAQVKSLTARLSERDVVIRELTEQRDTAIAAVEAMAVEDQAAGLAP